MKIKYSLTRHLILPAYLLMITVNALANILPINNLNTGQVSDSYPNLFAPAGLTFSIWGLIYLMLLGYSINQISQKKPTKNAFGQISNLFILSCLVNSTWIFAWHYKLIGLTVVLMLALLFILIRIANLLRKEKLSTVEKLVYKVPFGVYFGWITVATIANITAFLVGVGWNKLGLPDATWMVIVLLVGLTIAILRMHYDRNIAYGLVPIWAYFGIWYKHTSPNGFNNAYPVVINTVLVCIGLLALSNAVLVAKKKAL